MTSLYDVFTATDKIKQIKLDYIKNRSLKSQILFTYGNVHLMNVSKTYSNDTYLGVNFLFMVNKELLKVNRDVNRGYSEQLVDNFDELVKFPHFIHTCKTYDNAFLNNQKITTESFSFTHQNEKVRCIQCFTIQIRC